MIVYFAGTLGLHEAAGSDRSSPHQSRRDRWARRHPAAAQGAARATGMSESKPNTRQLRLVHRRLPRRGQGQLESQPAAELIAHATRLRGRELCDPCGGPWRLARRPRISSPRARSSAVCGEPQFTVRAGQRASPVCDDEPLRHTPVECLHAFRPRTGQQHRRLPWAAAFASCSPWQRASPRSDPARGPPHAGQATRPRIHFPVAGDADSPLCRRRGRGREWRAAARGAAAGRADPDPTCHPRFRPAGDAPSLSPAPPKQAGDDTCPPMGIEERRAHGSSDV